MVSDNGSDHVCLFVCLFFNSMTRTSVILFVLHQSFTLEFHFDANEFFMNTVLTKTYKMRSEPDESDPFSYDGPEIASCTGWGRATLTCTAFFGSSLNRGCFLDACFEVTQIWSVHEHYEQEDILMSPRHILPLIYFVRHTHTNHILTFFATAAQSIGSRARTSHWKQSRRNRSTRAVALWGSSPRRCPTTPSSTFSLRQRVKWWSAHEAAWQISF